MVTGPESDEELIRRTAEGDTGAFEVLYDRYARAAFSLALRIVGDARMAEDVAQDAFLNIWRKAKSFDSTRGAARSWILGTVHHRSVDVYRRTRNRPTASEPINEQVVSGGDDLWTSVTGVQDAEAVRAAMERLPAEQRDVLELAYFGGYSHTEIAAIRGLPLGTVKSRIRMAMDKMRESLRAWRTEP
ncbi:MAG: sigma-70 family RNA polymerase sigma factor [Dehalococcoidia bacterium]